MSYNSYCITVRPRAGLIKKTLADLVQWCEKQDYAVLYVEKDNEAKHAHIQVWSEEKRPKGIIAKAMQRICSRTIEDWDAAQNKVLRAGVKIAYSDWWLDYLAENEDKPEDEGECIYDNPPKSDTLLYYPTEAEQDAVLNKINAVDHKYHQLSVLFHEWNEGDISHYKVGKFLSWAMYDSKKIMVSKDKMTRINLCRNLYYYLKPEASSAEDFMNEEDFNKAMKVLEENLFGQMDNGQ